MDKTHTPPAGLGYLFDPNTLTGALVLATVAFAIATVIVLLIRRFTRRLEKRLSDITVLRFVSLLAQLLVYLAALVLYAHVIPELRSIGTALLAGASVLSVVAGLAAQTSLGAVFAGIQIAFSDAIRVGDVVVLEDGAPSWTDCWPTTNSGTVASASCR